MVRPKICDDIRKSVYHSIISDETKDVVISEIRANSKIRAPSERGCPDRGGSTQYSCQDNSKTSNFYPQGSENGPSSVSPSNPFIFRTTPGFRYIIMTLKS